MKIINETDSAVYLKHEGDHFEIDIPAKACIEMRQGRIEIKKVK